MSASPAQIIRRKKFQHIKIEDLNKNLSTSITNPFLIPGIRLIMAKVTLFVIRIVGYLLSKFLWFLDSDCISPHVIDW